MDFTKVNCISEQCKDKGIRMGGNGGCFGGRISYAGLKCPECGMTMTTEEERIKNRIKEAKAKSEMYWHGKFSTNLN